MLPAPCLPPRAEPGFSAACLQRLVAKRYADEHKPRWAGPVVGVTDVLVAQ